MSGTRSLDLLSNDALDTLPIEVAILDDEGTIVLTNEKWRQFGEANGLQQGDSVGVNYLAAIPESEDEYAASAAEGLRAVLAGKRDDFTLEYPCHSPNERRWFLMRASPFEQDGTRYVTVTHSDITERRLAEEEVNRTAAELAEDREQLVMLNQVVRHDIRNDMTLLLADAQRLLESADSESRESAEHITETAEHVVDLTNAVRDLSTVITEERDPERHEVALGPLLAAEAEKVRTSTWGDANAVRIEGIDELPQATVLGGDMLSSVFGNLLSNAVLHNDTAHPEISVDATVDSETVRVRIADDGPGIPDDRKETVFGRGEKGMESPGSGLGLYLVEELVDLYGGSVRVEDNDPRGAVFVVELQRA